MADAQPCDGLLYNKTFPGFSSPIHTSSVAAGSPAFLLSQHSFHDLVLVHLAVLLISPEKPRALLLAQLYYFSCTTQQDFKGP
jgi:hypothetical protein